MCLAFGVERLDELGEKVASVLELQPPQGMGDKIRALGKLKSLADSRAKTVSKGPVPGGRARAAGSRPPADPHLLAGRRRPLHHAAVGLHQGPAHRRAQRRHVPAAEVRRDLDGPALADPQGRRRRLARRARAAWRSRSRSAAIPITAYAGSCPAPKHVDELMVAGFLRGKPVELVQCKTVDLQVPARAEIVLEGYCERGELADEGPFGDHTGYYTPAEPFPVLRLTCMTMRRDAIYPSILVGPAAGRGRLAGQGHGAPLPARPAHHAARARRLRPAGRRGLPQLLHRLDPQGLSRSRAQGHARDLGHGPALADEDGDRRRRVGRRPRLRRGRLAGRREHRSRARRRAGARAARPARPRAVAAGARRQARARRDRAPGPARATRASGPRSRA